MEAEDDPNSCQLSCVCAYLSIIADDGPGILSQESFFAQEPKSGYSSLAVL